MVGVYVLTPKHVDTEADETHTPFLLGGHIFHAPG